MLFNQFSRLYSLNGYFCQTDISFDHIQLRGKASYYSFIRLSEAGVTSGSRTGYADICSNVRKNVYERSDRRDRKQNYIRSL